VGAVGAVRATAGVPRRVLVAMSGGVDSSVAAARLVAQGHEVTGVTLKLWGGEGDSGCCSVSDVEDARRVAAQLGIPHYVFNFADDFEAHVVGPYAAAYARGETPNPCADCNRTMKWGRLLARARRLGFEVLATGHHARIDRAAAGPRLRRGADPAKDQSYVLAMLGPAELAATWLPIGGCTKREVRAEAARLGLRTAAKPDSMDVCFIAKGGRTAFLDRRVPAVPGPIVDAGGEVLGRHRGVTRFTVGQRRGLGVAVGAPRYVVDVDAATATVTVGPRADLLRDEIRVTAVTSTGPPLRAGAPVLAQCSAHGSVVAGRFEGDRVRLAEPRARVAPGQLVALYDPSEPDVVLGSARAR
jgi:tRNA-specific 2-thiouridylase